MSNPHELHELPRYMNIHLSPRCLPPSLDNHKQKRGSQAKQSSEVEQQRHRHIHRPAGIAMGAVACATDPHYVPTTCHCGVRAAPGDGICSAATCSGLHLCCRPASFFFGGWPRQFCGGGVRMRKSRPAGAGLTLPRKRRFWHRRRRRGMDSSGITWLVRIPEKTKKLENGSGRIREVDGSKEKRAHLPRDC